MNVALIWAGMNLIVCIKLRWNLPNYCINLSWHQPNCCTKLSWRLPITTEKWKPSCRGYQSYHACQRNCYNFSFHITYHKMPKVTPPPPCSTILGSPVVETANLLLCKCYYFYALRQCIIIFRKRKLLKQKAKKWDKIQNNVTFSLKGRGGILSVFYIVSAS